MKKLIKTIKLLEQTRSKNDKAEIVKNNDSPELRDFFYLSLSPYIKYHIKKIPKHSLLENNSIITFNDIKHVLGRLSNRDVTGNAAIELVKNTFEQCDIDTAMIFSRILLKNIKCGMSGKSFNKAVGHEVVPIFPCLLAEAYNEKHHSKLVKPYILQLKSDGARCESIITPNNATYYTRNGNEYLMNVPEITTFLNMIAVALGEDVMIDGEMVAMDGNGHIKREESNGLVNKAVAGTLSDSDASKLQFIIWDIVPTANFYAYYYDKPYIDRYNVLVDVFKLVSETYSTNKVVIAETLITDNLQEALDKAEYYISIGEEGGMLKSSQLLWENKRTNTMLKIKGERECDLRVIGFEYGDPTKGLSEGIGSLIMQSEDGLLEVNVSSGLTMAQSGYIKDDNGNYVIDKAFDLTKYNNSVCKVVYATVTKSSKTNIPSLFSPRIAELARIDKNVADTLEDILK